MLIGTQPFKRGKEFFEIGYKIFSTIGKKAVDFSTTNVDRNRHDMIIQVLQMLLGIGIRTQHTLFLSIPKRKTKRPFRLNT